MSQFLGSLGRAQLAPTGSMSITTDLDAEEGGIIRLIPTLTVIASMLPVGASHLDGVAIPASRSLASKVAPTVSLPRRTGFQGNALAEVAITLKNV